MTRGIATLFLFLSTFSRPSAAAQAPEVVVRVADVPAAGLDDTRQLRVRPELAR